MNPTQSAQPVPESDDVKNERKLKLVEKLLELDLGLHMVVAAVLLFVAIFVFAWRFNLIGAFQGKAPLRQSQQTQQAQTNKNKAIIADSLGPSPFINGQIVEIDKAFKAQPSNIKLTINGQLKKEVFGFLPYWLLDNSDKIDLRLLTSVSYFGLDVDSKGELVKTNTDPKNAQAWNEWQSSQKLDQFIARAKKNRTKVYVTIKNFNPDSIERLVTSPEAHENFINNALYLMNSRNLDGINIDFEYVGTPPQKAIDGFSILISDLNKELKRQYPKSHLTVCTFVDAAANTRLYDVAILAQNSDGLVIMGYDFHTPNSSQAGPVAPMEGGAFSMKGLLSSYIDKVPTDKIILAVPYYGYDWPVSSGGSNGTVAGTSADVKVYPYAQIMEATKNTQINWDDNAQTPWYSYNEGGVTRVVHFENARSLGIKYDYINEKNLQGVGIWALGFDGVRTELLQLISDKFAN